MILLPLFGSRTDELLMTAYVSVRPNVEGAGGEREGTRRHLRHFRRQLGTSQNSGYLQKIREPLQKSVKQLVDKTGKLTTSIFDTSAGNLPLFKMLSINRKSGSYYTTKEHLTVLKLL